jgi:hypothetical protein
VGGISARSLFPLVKKDFLASLTLLVSFSLSYRKTTNLSRLLMSDTVRLQGLSITRKASVASGEYCHVFQAFFFPLPAKNDTVSQPVNA